MVSTTQLLLLQDHWLLQSAVTHALQVAAHAKALGLPYVPFRIILCEGRQAHNGDSELAGQEQILRNVPVWVSLGGVCGSRCIAAAGLLPTAHICSLPCRL